MAAGTPGQQANLLPSRYVGNRRFPQGGVMLALVEAAVLRLRAARLEADLGRCRAHLDDGDAAVRKHAREWYRQFEAEGLLLCRWRSKIAVGALS